MKGTFCGPKITTVVLALMSTWSCSASNDVGQASPGTQAAPAATLIVTAVPMYRLLVYPDVPEASRLFVVKTRIEPIGDDLLHFSPADMRLTLEDGTSGRVFDRGRASALVDSLSLTETAVTADPRGLGWNGRLAPALEAQLKQQILAGLLDERLFTRSEPVDGYVVLDTSRASSSLNGAALEVTVTRVSDEMVESERYQFGVRPAPAGATSDAASASAP